VIAYVQRKYGKENVAQLITFGTWKPRGAVRDVGRVLEMPYAEVDRIAKMIPPDVKMEDDYHLDDEAGTAPHSIWTHPHFVFAVAAQFLYVAAQAGIFSFFINYMTSQTPPVPESVVSGALASWFERGPAGALRLTDSGAATLAWGPRGRDEVLGDRQRREHQPAFRDEADAELRDAERGQPGDRSSGLLDDALGQVVDGRDAPAERCRQARARLERSGLERLAGQRAGDDGGRAVGQRCASGDLGNGEGQPAREARDETGLGVEPARAGEGAGHPDDPAASEVVLDVGRIDLGVVAGAGRDGHRLEAPDGGAGERRQRERGSVSHGSHRTGWSVPVPSTHARRCGGPPADAGAPAGAPDRARESRLAVPSRAAAVRRVGPDASA